MKVADISDLEILNLAAHILNMNLEEKNNDEIFEEFDCEYGVDLWRFRNVIECIVPLITIGESTIDRKKFKGFSANGNWIIKYAIEDM